MRTPKSINRRLFSLLWLFLCGLSALPAYGLTAKTEIHSRHAIEDPATIDIEIDVVNTGTMKIYDPVATITIADWAEPYDELGDISPGGTIQIKSRYVNPKMKPGTYIATVLVNFVKRGGELHRKYHFFEITYRPDKAGSAPGRVSCGLEAPVINKKILWGQKRNIIFSMKNPYQKKIDVRAHFCLPRGLATTKTSGFYTLAPGEERLEKIPLILSDEARHENGYHATVWYTHNGTHYSKLLQDKILVVSKPVYFRWYIVLGTAFLLILSGIIYYRGKRR